MSPPLRVLLAKAGLDGHDRGVKVVASMLRDAGMHVIYLGLHRSSAAIARAALEEGADVIGLSSLGGTHLAHAAELIAELRAHGLDDVAVVLGGTLPVEDIPALEGLGVRAVLRPGASREDIVAAVTRAAAPAARP